MTPKKSIKFNEVTLIAGLQKIINLVFIEGGYTVIVCPNQNMTTQIAGLVGSLVSEKGKFSGRTVTFPSDGKVSVVCAEDDIFISDEESFSVEFVGWTARDNSKGMTKWQSKAL